MENNKQLIKELLNKNLKQLKEFTADSEEVRFNRAIYLHYVEIGKDQEFKRVNKEIFYNNLIDIVNKRQTQESDKTNRYRLADEKEFWISRNREELGVVWSANNIKSYWINVRFLKENTKSEEVEEGKLSRAIGTAAMAATTMFPSNAQSKINEPIPIEKSMETKVVKNTDGSYTSTARGIAPTLEFAKELAINNAKIKILSALNLSDTDFSNTTVINEKKMKNKNGTFTFIVTINGKI